MADAVTGTVNQVERSVLEIIEGWELTNLEDSRRAFFECDFTYISASAEISWSARVFDMEQGSRIGEQDYLLYITR